MYVIYEDDYEQTAVPSMDSDGRIEVIWDHPDFTGTWSARWAPYPYSTPWRVHSRFNAETSFDTWSAYLILLLHFSLYEVGLYLNSEAIIAASPEAIISFKKSITGGTVLLKNSKLEPFPSCFISHSSVDSGFLHKIYRDLRAAGIRCWYAPEDLKIGVDILAGIRQAIATNDKVLLVLSNASIKSGWVQDEIEKVFAEERASGTIKLFPIMIDEAPMESKVHWVSKIRESRNIGDFRNWENDEIYREHLARVLRDLRP